MSRIDTNDYIDWVNQRSMRGKYFFTKEDILSAFPSTKENTLLVALNRLVDGRWIMSPWQNFYVIVPTQYKLKGEIPPSYFIDELMMFLGRKYYVSLLSAASLNGAGHQRAMSFFVTADGETLRSNVRSGTKMVFIQKKDIDMHYVQEVRTEGGYMNVSSPLMTALDLIKNERKVGGMSRVAEVLFELIDNIDLSDNHVDLMSGYNVAILQKMGYLTRLLGFEDKEQQWFDLCQRLGIKFRYVKLKNTTPSQSEDERDDRWKIIVNYEIDIDEI